MTLPHPLPRSEIPSEPDEILHLSPEEADALLEVLEAEVSKNAPVVKVPPPSAKEAIVVGDTHGDWRSTRSAAQRFLEQPEERLLIGLGDYVDRAPADCGNGSVANALYLLGLSVRYPGRVILIQGNHETTRRFPVLPHDLPEEVDDLWGPDVSRLARLEGLLERGPFGVVLTSGAYLAHGGFPRGETRPTIDENPSVWGEAAILDSVWGEAAASRMARGVVPPFTALELERFLGRWNATVFLRGHDPDLTGRWMLGGRCLTLHTTRWAQRFGGVVIARLPVDRPIRGPEDVVIEHLETEGQLYEEPW